MRRLQPPHLSLSAVEAFRKARKKFGREDADEDRRSFLLASGLALILGSLSCSVRS